MPSVKLCLRGRHVVSARAHIVLGADERHHHVRDRDVSQFECFAGPTLCTFEALVTIGLFLQGGEQNVISLSCLCWLKETKY